MRRWRMAALALTVCAGAAGAEDWHRDESERIDRILKADPPGAADPVGLLFLGPQAAPGASGSKDPGYAVDPGEGRTQRLGGAQASTGSRRSKHARKTRGSKRAKRSKRPKGSKRPKRSRLPPPEAP